MVGVAGRSKACGQCRRRRVRCDEAKPNCQRCIKAKLNCGGYRDMTIIQYNGQTKQSNPIQTPSPSKSSNQTQSPEELQELTPFEDIAFKPYLSILPLADDVFVNFTKAQLLSGNGHVDPAAQFMKTELSDQCFLALATSYFGNEHQETRIVQHGLKRYGSALQRLHSALGNLDQHTSYDLLEAITVMSLFEYLMSETIDGWIGHSLGLERLMELRGPETFKRPADRAVFQTSRLSIILASIVLHRKTILSQASWKNIPWEDEPQKKEPFQYLVDLLTGCSELFMVKDSILACTSAVERHIFASQLWESTDSLLQQVDVWRASWEIVEADSWFEVPAGDQTPSIMSSDGVFIPCWSTSFEYKSLQHANALTIYHAAIILLLKLLRDLASMPGLSFSAPHDLEERLYSSGIDICRSVDYHSQMMFVGARSFYILFPLRMAWDAVGQLEPAIGEWLQDALRRVRSGKAGKWAIAGHLMNTNVRSREAVPVDATAQ